MNCATAASTQALVTALLLQVSNECVDAAADVLAVVLCRCLSFPASPPSELASAISPMRALRLRPEDSCRVSFACCYTAGILPHEVLADAGGTAAEISEFWHLASGIL